MLTTNQHDAVTALRADDMHLAANAASRQWTRGYKYTPIPLLPVALRQQIKAANADVKVMSDPRKLA
jgi:hypothetical protein